MINLEKLTLKLITMHHANMVDINNSLNALGLKSNDSTELSNKKHVMAVVNAYERRGYHI